MDQPKTGMQLQPTSMLPQICGHGLKTPTLQRRRPHTTVSMARCSSSKCCNNSWTKCNNTSASFGNKIPLPPSLLEVSTIAIQMKTTIIWRAQLIALFSSRCSCAIFYALKYLMFVTPETISKEDIRNVCHFNIMRIHLDLSYWSRPPHIHIRAPQWNNPWRA